MFVLKKRKYTWLDMYRIPFSCAPVSTVLVTIQKAVTALVNIFQVVVVAEFLDGTIDAVLHKNYDRKLILWFVLMLLMVSWKRVSYNIGRLFTDGCVREQGSHEELMAMGGIYAEMYETQQGWYVREES